MSMFSFCDCESKGEIGGEAYASRVGAWNDCGRGPIMGFEDSELKDVKGVRAIECAIDEPNDSDRFISGGESSEEIVKR